MHVEDSALVSTLSEQLGGPPLLGAVYARFDTPLSFTRMLTPLGNYLIARPAARAEARKVTEETDVPLDAAVVFGVSTESLHVWSADPMLSQVHEHLGEVPRDTIATVSTTAGRTWQTLVVTVTNVHAIEVEARGGVHDFVSAF
ncbi:MAG: hypothetical protein ACR2PL_24000 [Dehalococcoidia bacterium]